MRRSGQDAHVDERIRLKQTTHASALDVVQHRRFEIDLDGTRHILLVGDFVKVDGKSVKLEMRRRLGSRILSGFYERSSSALSFPTYFADIFAHTVEAMFLQRCGNKACKD